MKRLIVKVTVLALLTGAPLCLFMYFFADGNTNALYARFTTGRKPSLVIGLSDCFQGIVPSVFNASSLEFARPLYNFCFLKEDSPFGPSYLSGIKKKLDTKSRNGLFIVGVNPWCFSIPKDRDDRPSQFPDRDNLFEKLHCYDCNPNFEYLFAYYGFPFYNLLKSHFQGEFTVQEDGWVNVHVPYDTSRFNASKADRLKNNNFSNLKMSSARMRYFEETVEYLKRHGEVVLVHLPMSREYAELQKAYSPGFDSMIQAVADRNGLLYCNLINESGTYQTLDGTHLWKECSVQVSRRICAMIEKHRKTRPVEKG